MAATDRTDQLISLASARAQYPWADPPSIRTMNRWAREGQMFSNGQKVILRTTQINRRMRWTTLDWVQEFIDACGRAHTRAEERKGIRSAGYHAAGERLKVLGFS